MYGNFNATGTVTGRFSCNDPNLQQIPRAEYVKGDLDTHIRSLFVAPEGQVMLTADYTQIELVLMAEFSRDTLMSNALINGDDLHQQTADLCNTTRPNGKTLNFAVGYGVSPKGYSVQSGLPIPTASEHIDAFFKRYSGLKRCIDRVHDFTRQNGYIRTMVGRKRRFPQLASPSIEKWALGRIDRASFNTLIQGSAADLIKMAIVQIYKQLDHKKCRLCMTVHDEVSAFADKDYAEEAYHIIKYEMENVINTVIPIRAPVNIGKRWSENK